MRKIATTLLIVSLVCAPILVEIARGEAKNLPVDQKITAKIKAFDKKFFKGFDVYSAGTEENPVALLFDRKDQYHLPAPSWEKPLFGEQEIIYAIKRLNLQYEDKSWNIPLQPRVLRIVNTKGAVLGYVYTGVETIVTDREEDGRVTVFRPSSQMFESGGAGGGGRN